MCLVRSKCLNPYNMGGVVEGEAACWQESPCVLPHMHCGCLVIVSSESCNTQVSATQFSPQLNTNLCGLRTWPLAAGHLAAPLVTKGTSLSLSFSIKWEQYDQVCRAVTRIMSKHRWSYQAWWLIAWHWWLSIPFILSNFHRSKLLKNRAYNTSNIAH